MDFYDRKTEIESLKEILEQSRQTATMTVIIGRRRIGKTSLLMQSFKNEKRCVYLFVSRTSESVLCDNFCNAIERQSDLIIAGHPNKTDQIMELLFREACITPLTVIIDEFQDFEYVNHSFFSYLQNLWDRYHQKAKINLIVCGSIYSMMVGIFENSKEPLFGRMTHKIKLNPFRIEVLKEILHDYNPTYTTEDLLCLYMLTGGVPMYVSLLMDQKAITKDSMLDVVCKSNSRFLTEATDMLIGEFGKQYTNYFGIMQLIANGLTTQKEIDSVVGKNTGTYMQTLEKEYSLIRRNLPYGSKPGTRNIRWQINDNFLMFWFRFIAPNARLIEQNDTQTLRLIIEEGYRQFSGLILERYFRQKIAEEEHATEIESWWDRKGENEVDLIAINRLEKWVKIAEIKRNKNKIDMNVLKKKASSLHHLLPRYPVQTLALSMENM